jgi:anti-sigma B factor antagonist
VTGGAHDGRPSERGSSAGHSRLRASLARDDGVMVVALDGDLDVNTVAGARARMDEAISRASSHEITRVVVDASALGFCDSTGLSVLVRAADAANAAGLQFALRALSPPMLELLRITGLDELVERQS